MAKDIIFKNVSTHSRAEAAAVYKFINIYIDNVSTHSRAEAAAYGDYCIRWYSEFQHTAARRRLHRARRNSSCSYLVSTHSRAEAAAGA